MQPHAGRHIRRTFKHYLEDRSPCYSTLTSSLFPTNFECHHWLVRQGNEMGGKKKRKEGGREGRGGGGERPGRSRARTGKASAATWMDHNSCLYHGNNSSASPPPFSPFDSDFALVSPRLRRCVTKGRPV